jgi:hypothetical protein
MRQPLREVVRRSRLREVWPGFGNRTFLKLKW